MMKWNCLLDIYYPDLCIQLDKKYPVITKGIFILSVTRKNGAFEEQGRGSDHGENSILMLFKTLFHVIFLSHLIRSVTVAF